jgi:putative glutamine amidotransferase
VTRDPLTHRPPPLIGLSTSEVRAADGVRPTPEGEPPQRELALGLKYMRAVADAGGVPVVLAPLGGAALGALLDRLSGICLSGGPDLHPSAYRQAPHPGLGPTEPDVDAFEIALARGAERRGLPVLGICRGAQVMNVARGGNLHQHLPDVVGTRVTHRQPEPDHQATHAVEVSPGSLLAQILGAPAVAVNSFHHQAVDRLGRGLRAVAFAADGTVEAVEAPGAAFALGVQWHAEGMTGRPDQAALFAALVAAARRRDAAPAAAVA